MANQNELRQQITNQIIEALKSGTPPWRRPWCSHHNSGHPVNVVSRRPYSGVNPLILQIAARRHGLRSKFWGTFNQWKALGGKVKPRPADVPPGRWGTSIVFFKPVKKVEVNKDTGEEEEVRFGFLRSYTVFNVDQVEGAHLDHLRVGDTPATSDFVDFEPAERAILATSARIIHGGDRAFYRRIAEAPGRKLVERFTIPIRSGRAWTVPAGHVFRILTPDGPQVGDLNLWNRHNPRERLWASRTRQLQAAHVSVFDRLWSTLPYLRPIATITSDSLKDYGIDEFGGRIHDLLGTR